MAWAVGGLWPPVVTVNDLSTNPAGELADPTTVVFTITSPNKTVTTPAVEHLETGVYRVKVSLTEAGEWTCKVTGTGVHQASTPVFKINVVP